MWVRLYTKANEFVVAAEIPPFEPPPEILMWGERVFRHESEDRYTEGLAWFIPPQSPLRYDEG